MIDGRNFFDEPVNNKEGTYDNIQKITNGGGDVYLTGCLLDYHYFKNHFEIIIIYLSR